MNTRLEKLKKAKSIHDLAEILGYTPKGMGFIVYGTPDEKKYTEFSIPKRQGGYRKISAPNPKLKTLQKQLKKLIEECDPYGSTQECKHKENKIKALSHGFKKKHSIMTNSTPHVRHRYVFNIDIKDFFESINFGRVCGFFEKNNNFKLDPKISRTIAQIACHERSLPQGSPSSPVISNLIGHILDIRMVQLAKKSGCHYSRYADDLTFSTNKKSFPPLIALRIKETNQWEASKKLVHELRRCGFDINEAKTRMQYKDFRQDVTGIVVNSKINVRSDLIKNTRAMVHHLTTRGEFFIKKSSRDQNGGWENKTESSCESSKKYESKLRGVLSHIDHVRIFESKQSKENKKEDKSIDRVEKTYRDFLYFTLLYRPESPTIICEGKTDAIYMKYAIKSLTTNSPEIKIESLGTFSEIKFISQKESRTNRLLSLCGGTGNINNLIKNYKSITKKFKHEGKRHPVIILVDNDEGAKEVFSLIKKIHNSKRSIEGKENFYHIHDNMYVVALPKIKNSPTCIEHFFPQDILDKKIDEKTLSLSNQYDDKTHYGKSEFAKRVIKPNWEKIDFSEFSKILKRVECVLSDHAVRHQSIA